MADRKRRYPRAESPTEVRRAFALMNEDLGTVTDGLSEFIALVAATYVPYTGAIADVNLGAFDLTATEVNATTVTGGTVNATTLNVTGTANIDTISSTTTLSITNSVDMGGTYTVTNLAEPVDGSDAVTLDYLTAALSGAVVTDHGGLTGLADDDHVQYTLADGSRAFTGTVGGVTPVADADLATKAYVDGAGGTVTLDNDEGVALVIGTPVYISSDGAVSRAQASILAKACVFGLVKDSSIAVAGSGRVLFSGVLEATTGEWDTVTGGTGGLTPKSTYYLSLTLGQLTTVPVSEVGEICTEVGTAISTTQLKVEIRRTIEL